MFQGRPKGPVRINRRLLEYFRRLLEYFRRLLEYFVPLKPSQVSSGVVGHIHVKIGCTNDCAKFIHWVMPG
jgi:hypothetical protein